jgi:hypothetical protein
MTEQAAAKQAAADQAAAERAAQFAKFYAEDRLDDQLGYYTRRRKEAEKAHDQAIHAKWMLSTLAAIAGSVGAAVPNWRIGLAIAAAFLAAAAAALTAYQSLYAFPRVAKLYHDAELSLTALKAARDIRVAALTRQETRTFVERAEEVFSKENGQWGQLIQRAGSESAQPDSRH